MLLVETFKDPIVKILGNWSSELSVWTIIFRIILACLFGGIVGGERAKKHHAAGLRTHILVCVGACVAILVNMFFLTDKTDPGRLGAGVLTGIGFLGAGTMVVTSRNQVKGLTTAAGLWVSGVLGLAIGIGFYTLAVACVVVIIIVLIFLPKIEARIQKNSKAYDIHIELLSRPDLRKLLDFLRENNIVIKSIAYDPAYANTGLSVYSISLISAPKKGEKGIKYEELIQTLNKFDYVNYVEFMD